MELLLGIEVFITAFSYWARPTDEYDEAYFFTDQSEFEITAGERELSQEEFFNLWGKAIAQ